MTVKGEILQVLTLNMVGKGGCVAFVVADKTLDLVGMVLKGRLVEVVEQRGRGGSCGAMKSLRHIKAEVV